jgi:uroporphyrinogen decarboxylase
MTLVTWPWKPKPNAEALLAALRGEGAAFPVQVLEFLVDPEIVTAILDSGVLPDRAPGPAADSREQGILDLIHFYHSLGMSAFRAKGILDLPMEKVRAKDTARYSRDERSWVNEQRGLVTNWEEFEHYPWPRAEDADFHPLEYAISHLPEGMTVFAKSYGILEQAMWLMGYETFAYCLHDDPDLVGAIFSKIEEIYQPFNRALTQIEGVSGLWMGDDMGFRSGTMVNPEHLRKYVFPLQKQVADYCHEQGILFLMHSCGSLAAIMDDLIDKVGIDGKHSFEDVIMPVEDFVAAYGERISTIGGLDIDLLARGSEEQVRARTRTILEACQPSGAYVLGSGNSVTNYVKPENFLAMIDECRRFNEKHL